MEQNFTELALRTEIEATFLHLPEARTCFAEREMRLRQLAAGHAMQDFLLFMAELAHAPWIVTGVIGPHGREFDEIFHGQNLPAPKARTRCESMIALLSLLAGSDALTFVPYQWTSAPVTRTLLAEIKLTETIPGAPRPV